MKIGKNQILALSLALIIALPPIAILAPIVNADGGIEDIQNLPVELKPWRKDIWGKDIWYKFETPLVTLIFPASGKKPMFLWWYTNDSSEIYVVKFKGVIEYLIFDKPYYLRRYRADNLTINTTLWKDRIEPKVCEGLHETYGYQYEYQHNYDLAIQYFWGVLFGLHPAFLPFSACSWTLDPPQLVQNDDVSYWAFNFTLTEVPMDRFDFARNNIQIRCRFYNATTTEVPDEKNPSYNYTVAAGQLKFDFVVSNWEWNIDKLQPFFDWLEENYEIEIPEHKTGLALWINMASIKIEDLTCAENEIQYQAENHVEARSQMRGAFMGDEYQAVDKNETATDQDERPIQLREQFRERVRIHFARREETIAGFLEFVPWARLLDEAGETVDYVDVTASYIAAGGHLRLFICYPYFGDHTLEHDPTIGLASAPPLPTLIKPIMLAILIGTTVLIAVAVAAVKIRKKTVNIVSAQ